MLISSTVLKRPQLLEYHIRAQYLPALDPDTRTDYGREDRIAALWLVQQLAKLRHEQAADTLRDLLAN